MQPAINWSVPLSGPTNATEVIADVVATLPAVAQAKLLEMSDLANTVLCLSVAE